MEDLYSIHPGIAGCGGELRFNEGVRETNLMDLIKARISSHPRYSSLLSAYIECRKVGAPPEMATQLEEITRKRSSGSCCCGGGDDGVELGADPELDEFMDSYCRVLVRYKDELSKPFEEAVSFLANIEAQLRSLCNVSAPASSSSSSAASSAAAIGTGAVTFDDALGSSEEEPSYDYADALENQDSCSRAPDNELKEMLLKKYSGYLSNLRKEFSKKKKKGKLPKEARSTLLDWWNAHYKWPYPTDDEKTRLVELTGLDQKQINNWFINQRKRHWKPSEDVQYAIMEGLWGGPTGTTLCFQTGTIGPSN